MTRFLFLVCLLLLVVGPVFGGIEGDIRAIDTQRINALLKGDRAVLESLLADDLTYGRTDGKIDTKQNLLNALAQSHASYRNYEASAPNVRVLGDTALINGSAELQTVAANKTVAISFRYLAVYQKRREGWQLVAYQSTQLADSAARTRP